jgi:hypothetical protein
MQTVRERARVCALPVLRYRSEQGTDCAPALSSFGSNILRFLSASVFSSLHSPWHRGSPIWEVYLNICQHLVYLDICQHLRFSRALAYAESVSEWRGRDSPRDKPRPRPPMRPQTPPSQSRAPCTSGTPGTVATSATQHAVDHLAHLHAFYSL